MSTLYHYTSREAIERILEAGVINTADVAHFGQGVYFTAMPPLVDDNALAYNNWDGTVVSAINYMKKGNKIQAYIAIDIKYLPGVKQVGNKEGRDIWLYPAEVNLRNIRFKVGINKGKNVN